MVERDDRPVIRIAPDIIEIRDQEDANAPITGRVQTVSESPKKIEHAATQRDQVVQKDQPIAALDFSTHIPASARNAHSFYKNRPIRSHNSLLYAVPHGPYDPQHGMVTYKPSRWRKREINAVRDHQRRM